jgi:riboflavin kinase/FMN adenylyltransferase
MDELLNSIVSPDQQEALSGGTVITIGNFDGVHRGHQTIIGDVTDSADDKNLLSLALTFEPHPAELFTDKEAEQYRIATSSERVELLKHHGIDRVVTIPFTHEFAELPPETFVIDFLIERLHAAEIHIGYDFAFGKGRAGNTRSLQKLCAQYDVGVEVHEAVSIDEAPISSTRVREHLRAGEVGEASSLLGHVYAITGKQVAGQQRGRQMGIPTVNLSAEGRMLPHLGVYSSLVTIDDGDTWMRSITNVGKRPTFEDSAEPNIETHILDREVNVTDQTGIRLALLDFIRDEMTFDGPDALKEQIGKDVETAQSQQEAYLQGIEVDALDGMILPYPWS